MIFFNLMSCEKLFLVISKHLNPDNILVRGETFKILYFPEISLLLDFDKDITITSSIKMS